MSAKQQVPNQAGVSLILAIALLALALALGGMTLFLSSKKVQGFALSDNGSVIPMIPMDQPYVNDARVVGFVDECLRMSFAHDFENFRMTMASAKKCYTPSGAVEFESAMNPLILDMQAKSLVMSVSLEPTVVTKAYKLSGVVYWETQTPMTLSRRGVRETLVPVKFLVETTVRRVPLDQDVRGISVRTINVKPMV